MSTRSLVTTAVLESAVATALAALAAGNMNGYGVALKGQSGCAAGPAVACDHPSSVDSLGNA